MPPAASPEPHERLLFVSPLLRLLASIVYCLQLSKREEREAATLIFRPAGNEKEEVVGRRRKKKEEKVGTFCFSLTHTLPSLAHKHTRQDKESVGAAAVLHPTTACCLLFSSTREGELLCGELLRCWLRGEAGEKRPACTFCCLLLLPPHTLPASFLLRPVSPHSPSSSSSARISHLIICLSIPRHCCNVNYISCKNNQQATLHNIIIIKRQTRLTQACVSVLSHRL